MDPLTQGVLGASLPQATQPARYALSAAVLGWLGGMAPDLDVLIRSPEDPLLFLEYHRHFTHALIFIPLGGLICALVLHALIGRRFGLTFKRSWLFCTLGYGTHAVLDACTTYGTLLLWPFSARASRSPPLVAAQLVDPAAPSSLPRLSAIFHNTICPWGYT